MNLNIQVSNNILAFGKIKDCFFCIAKHSIQDNDIYFSLYVVDDFPKEISEEAINEFLDEHETDGWSITGTLADVMKELQEVIGEL